MAITKRYSKDRKKCKVTFTLPLEAAPNATTVKVLGDFNGWNWNEGLALKATKAEFKGQIELATGTKYEFRYQIDQANWENDWKADDYVPSPIPGVTNSLLVLENGSKVATKKATKKAAKPAVKKKPVTKAKAAPKKTVKATAKKPTKAKNFTVIEGIGPKINSLLTEAGFSSFQELAKAKPAAIKKVLANAGSRYTMHDPTSWPKQAKLAADEKWDALKALQAKLKGGK